MIHPWLEAARPKTLSAAVIPVLVGSALAYSEGMFAWLPAMFCLVFALLIQIGTNYANDYSDYVRGADSLARIGPRRAVSSGLIAVGTMRKASFVVFGAAFLCGLELAWWRGWELLPLGVLCIFFGWAYTAGPFPLAYHGLGDVFVFIFFGLVAVGGTYYVMTGRIAPNVLVAAAPIGLLATNILVVNNYRDIVSDERAGKHTLVVRHGRRFARRQYLGQLLLAGAFPVYLALKLDRPWLAVAVVTLLPGLIFWRRMVTTRDGPGLNALLSRTAALLMGFGSTWAPLLAFV